MSLIEEISHIRQAVEFLKRTEASDSAILKALFVRVVDECNSKESNEPMADYLGDLMGAVAVAVVMVSKEDEALIEEDVEALNETLKKAISNLREKMRSSDH